LQGEKAEKAKIPPRKDESVREKKWRRGPKGGYHKESTKTYTTYQSDEQ
jgi:hypothetical protein